MTSSLSRLASLRPLFRRQIIPQFSRKSQIPNSGAKPVNPTLKLVKRAFLLTSAVTCGTAGYFYYRLSSITEDDDCRPASNFEVTLYRKLPLRFMSRLWGQLNSVDVPHWLRKPAFSLYAWMFNCNLDEAAESDLTQYKNLSEFFRRQLKPHVRPVDSRFTVTSPADGRVLHLGKVEDCRLEQVKGVTYSLQGFLGPHTWNGKSEDVDDVDNEEKYHRGLLSSPDSELYHCIIYLAPGDYHRFHSPAKWNIKYRRHFPGDLLSVNPTVARWVQGLFNFNERVVYYGNWQHGFFSMTAVGATNVGSINVYFDPELNTNQRKKGPSFNKSFNDGIQCNKGDYFGEFNMGSTIVLIFEAPKNFEFNIRSGQKIRVGESVGTA